MHNIKHELKLSCLIMILLGFVSFYGCSDSVQDQDKEPLLKIRLQDTQNTTAPKTFSAVIEEYRFVRLDSSKEAMIGSPKKVLLAHENLYIQDLSTQSLLVFDNKGTFNFNIQKIGGGPGEYNTLSDFAVDRDTMIHVYDEVNKKIIVYSPKGDYVREQKLEFNGFSFGLSGNHYVFKTGGGREEVLLITNPNGTVEKGSIFTKSEITRYNLFKQFENTSPDSLLYFELLNDTVFLITGNMIQPYRVFDLGANAGSLLAMEDKLKIINEADFSSLTDYTFGVEGYCETNRFIAALFNVKGKMHQLLYDKISGKHLLYPLSIPNDISFGRMAFPLAFQGADRLVAILPAFQLASTLKKIQEGKDIDPNLDKKLMERFQIEMKGITESSNFVVFIGTPKPIY